MNIEKNLLEDCINFTDLKKKRKRYLKKIMPFFVIIVCLFLFFVLFKFKSKYFLYNNKKHLLY